jgi:hypothetical protein
MILFLLKCPESKSKRGSCFIPDFICPLNWDITTYTNRYQSCRSLRSNTKPDRDCTYTSKLIVASIIFTKLSTCLFLFPQKIEYTSPWEGFELTDCIGNCNSSYQTITTSTAVLSSNPEHGEVLSIQHYVTKVANDFWQV